MKKHEEDFYIRMQQSREETAANKKNTYKEIEKPHKSTDYLQLTRCDVAVLHIHYIYW